MSSFAEIPKYLREKYVFEYPLGCGSFGAVVAARNTRADKRVPARVSIKMVVSWREDDEHDQVHAVIAEVAALVAVQQKRPTDNRALHFPMVYELMLEHREVRGFAYSPFLFISTHTLRR